MEKNDCDNELEEYPLEAPGINELRPLMVVEAAKDKTPGVAETIEILETQKQWRKLARFLPELFIFSLALVNIFVFAIGAYSLFSLYQIDSGTTHISTHCVTSTCLKAAGRLLELQCDNFDPCQNFYQFSCGNLKGPSKFQEMHESMLLEIKELIENKFEEHEEMITVQKAKQLYLLCMLNFFQSSTYEDHTLPLLNVLESAFGQWPMLQGAEWNQSEYRLEGLLAQLFAHQVPNIFELHIVPDEADGPFQLSLGPGKPAISEAFFNVNNTNYVRYLASYKNLIMRSVQLLGHGKKANLKISEDIDDVIELERWFARIVQSSNCEFNGVDSFEEEAYTNINLKLRDIQEQLPQINVEYLVQQLFDVLGMKHNVSPEMKVSLDCIKFFREIVAFCQASDARTVTNYLIWRFVFHHLSYMGGDFREIWIEFLSHVPPTIGGTRIARWRKCVSIVNQELGQAIAYLYVQQNQQKLRSSEAIAEEISSYLIKAFASSITEQQWIEDEFKLQLIEKINHTNITIGGEYYLNAIDLEEEFKDIELIGSNFLLQILQIKKFNVAKAISNGKNLSTPGLYMFLNSPLNIEAMQVLPENAIVVLMGILRFPMFDESFPMYLNFANLGFVLGHELAHGLDSLGRHFDKDGKISSWWPKEAEISFKEKASCFADQYGKFKMEEVDTFLDGNRTLEDNIADNIALRITWLAYKMWAEDHNVKELPLPGTNFTVPQIFYITFGQIWCERLSKEAYYQQYVLDQDEHSPGQFRVLGVVQNDAEFGDIFGCPRETPMNPTHKCMLW